MKVIVNTGTSIIQAFYEKKGSTLKNEYRQATAVAFMDLRDMQKLSLKSRDKIKIKSEWGEVVLYADVSYDAPHEGIIFIPKGPWANIIISPETYCCNVPTYKGIPAEITKTDEEVLLVSELMNKVYNKYNLNNSNLSEKPLYKKKGDEQ
ncbi:MAG: formylmethanofuran dehydrogenase [Methanosphaera sp. rholeuAM6]|nr:MAG: formylmethanofuran dehydrogenase [Methanosphaera sp. rholeuAM6]